MSHATAMPTVAIFRSTLLSSSETFIRTQPDAFDRWQPVYLGLEREDSPLSRPSDTIALGGRWSRLQARAAKLTSRSRKLSLALVRQSPDVVHSHFGFDAVLIRSAARKYRIPHVVTFHGVDATAAPRESGFRGALYRHRLTRLFRDADRIIAVSDAIRRSLLVLGAPTEKLVVHHIGVRMDLESAGTTNTRAGVLFVGRLTEKKGVDDLINAYAGLDPELQVAHPLRIIGSGPEDQSLRALARDLDVPVDFAGAAHPDDVRVSMSNCAVFCSPSRTASNGDTEGLPMVLLEAAKERAPVVSTVHSGIPEAVINDETGLLVAEGDTAALRQAIARMLTDRDFAGQLADAGRQRVQRFFDVASQSRALEAIYDEVVSTHTSQTARRHRSR